MSNKRKAGRPLGSTSCVLVDKAQLMSVISAWPDHIRLPMNRRWVEQLHLKAEAMVANTKTIKALAEPASVTVTIPE